MLPSGKNYDNIINLPHHTSATRRRMARENRAVQFSPFAALTGYDDEIDEAARLTDEREEIDDDAALMLNERINYIIAHIAEKPIAELTYFIPDKLKSGGKYVTVTAEIRTFDEYERKLVLVDERRIPIDDIIDINGSIFE